MKRFIVLTVLLAVVVMMANVQFADAAGKKIRIAVIDFQNNSTWTWWGD